MRVTCPSCMEKYKVDDTRIPARGAKLKCAKCQTTFSVKPPEPPPASAEAVPLPGTGASPAPAEAVPLPGTVPSPAATSPSAAIPLPGGAPAPEAVPLPGSSPAVGRSETREMPSALAEGLRNAATGDEESDESSPTQYVQIPEALSGAVPLPGYDAPAQDADDGFDVVGDDEGDDQASVTTAIPAPDPQSFGVAQEDFGALPLPGGYQAPQDASALPLPGSDDFGAQAQDDPGALPLPGGYEAAEDASALPLPGSDDFGAQAQDDPGALPLPGGYEAAEDASGIPLPGSDDFGAQAQDDPGALPLPGSGGLPAQLATTQPYAERPAEIALPPEANAPEPAMPWGDDAAAAGFDLGPEPVTAAGPGGEDPFGLEQPTRAAPIPPEALAFGAPDAPPPPAPPPAAAPLDPDPFGGDFDFDEPTRVAQIPPEMLQQATRAAELSPTPAPAAPPAPPPAPAFGETSDVDFDFDQPTRIGPIPDFANADDPFANVSAAPATTTPPAVSAPPPAPAVAPPTIAPPAPEPAAPAPPPNPSFDFGGLDFDEGPAAAAPPAGAPAPAPTDPFADLPSPAPEPSADPFAAVASPAAPAPTLDPFADLPSAAASQGAPEDLFADVPSAAGSPPPEDLFANVPSATAAPAFGAGLDFGGVDLSGDAAPPSDDPFAGIDVGSKTPLANKAAARLYKVRRRTGNEIGPFGVPQITEMLTKRDLAGNEEISTDGKNWVPIGSVAALEAAVKKAVAAGPATSPESMEKLNHRYGGRMAAAAVVERKDPLETLKKRKVPIIAGALVVVLLAVGGSFQFTRYGAFGFKKLFPARISAGTPAAAQMKKAEAALLQDTFKGYKDALSLTQGILATREYPAARALWCQAVFYLQRRYAAASPGQVSQARQALPDIALLGLKNPEVVKAFAGAALAAHHPQKALAPLRDAIARDGSGSDPELRLLLAEAQADQKDVTQAIGTLKALVALRPHSAKAFHALGDLYQTEGKADDAAAAYEKALKASPQHVISAIELAAVDLLLRHQVQPALDALNRALEPKQLALMGPAEQARALALKGAALADQFKYDDAVKSLTASLRQDGDSVFAKYQLARIYRAQQEDDKALPLFKAVSEAQPKNLTYVDGYLSTLIHTGKMSDAQKILKKVRGSFPANARIAFLTGRVDDALHQDSDAEEQYKRAISEDPKLVEAHLFLGRFYLRQKKLSDAQTQLQSAAKQSPESAPVHAALGELALAQGNTQQAETELAHATQLDPQLAEGHLGLSRVWLAEGKVDDAKKEIDLAVKLAPELGGVHLQRGKVLWKLGKPDEALKELATAKTQEPDSIEVLVTAGAVHLDQKDAAGAEKELLLALQLDPLNGTANYLLAKALAIQGQYSQALDDMQRALRRDPKRADYHYELGLLLEASKSGDDAALAEWKKAVTLDPGEADAYEAIGKLYLRQGNFDDAVGAFASGLKAAPKRFELIGLQGDAYSQATQWSKAISRYEVALRKNPELTSLYYKIGRAYGESGNGAMAINWYKKATVAQPDDAMPFYYLGFAYKQRHQNAAAITAFKKYLAKRPSAPDRQGIEDEIYDLQHS